MPPWRRITPESMRCCGRARAGGASYVRHCVGYCQFSQRCPVVQHLLGIHQCLLSAVLTFPESDDPTPGKISCRPKTWPVMTLVWRHTKPGSGTPGVFLPSWPVMWMKSCGLTQHVDMMLRLNDSRCCKHLNLIWFFGLFDYILLYTNAKFTGLCLLRKMHLAYCEQ